MNDVRTQGGTGPAVAMVLGSCVSLQVGAALAARLFPEIGTIATTFLRLGLAAVLLLLVVRPRIAGWSGLQWWAVVALGVSFAGMNGFFYASIARIPLGTAVTIEFLGPLALAAVLSRRARDLIWVALAAAGVALLGLAGRGADGAALDPVGVGFALVAALFWALYILTSARVGSQVPGQGGLAVATAIGALVLLPSGISGSVEAFTRTDLIVLAVLTAVLASVIPYTLELAALRRLRPSVFGILLSLEPAVAAVAGWTLLSQALGAAEAIAIPVVIAASIGSTLSNRRRTAVAVRDAPAASADAGQVGEAVDAVGEEPVFAAAGAADPARRG